MFDLNKLSPEDQKKALDWAGFFSYKITWAYNQLLFRPESTVFLSTGNQAMKTSAVTHSYVMRIFGWHPIEHKNLRPHHQIRTIRFASETLPITPDGEETKNTIYPAFKRWLPSSLIKKDVSTRRSTMVIRDPQGGPDINIEFVSYNQSVQSQSGIQRWSIYLDEHAPHDFYEEQLPRLDACKSAGYGGDMVLTLTPAINGITWEYDKLFAEARTIIRSPIVVARYKKRFNQVVPIVEKKESMSDICVIMTATDDNPIMTNKPVNCSNADCSSNKNLGQKKGPLNFEKLGKDSRDFTIWQCPVCSNKQYGPIDDRSSKYDLDTEDIRRFGIFRQASGTIFQEFDKAIHRIPKDLYFPSGLPLDWSHFRAIDFHPHVPWAVSWVMLSFYNEAFVYKELNPDPDKNVTYVIAAEIARMSSHYKFKMNLIDPLSTVKQNNTTTSPCDDLNLHFREFKRDNICESAYWSAWDTKGDKGRDAIKERLVNSKRCQKPFNNKVVKDGMIAYLPTLWILDTCLLMVESLQKWRWDDWADRNSLLTKDEKDKPQQKFSHFPMTLEALFKDNRFRPPIIKPIYEESEPSSKKYFAGSCK